MKHEESEIQAAICQYLQAQGIFFFSVPNEGAGKNAIRQSQLMAMGLRPGVADLIVWWPAGNGAVTQGYLEVKTPAGRQSRQQKKFERFCQLNGVPYLVVRSVEDVKSLVTDLRRKCVIWEDFQTLWGEC